MFNYCVCFRRLLTQLEVARGVRSCSGGEGKSAAPKGPDGVVLYELHSRPEHEKFTESAKVQCISSKFTFSIFLTLISDRVAVTVTDFLSTVFPSTGG